MVITGIISEYNPLHLGHKKQLDSIRAAHPQGGIVCLMSGNYVQRGTPAIVDKTLRAKAAVLCGADLVLELPITASLRSAEGFASEGVRILSPFCDQLSFGAEDPDALEELASALLEARFSVALKAALEQGISFPAARQAALEDMGLDGSLLSKPNNILAVEYCKAILQQNSSMTPLPILRQGGYHDLLPDPENPSATALRALLENRGDWQTYVPEAAAVCFSGATLHSIHAGEKSILYRLRTMADEEFKALPFGSEGLWRKLMHAARTEATLEAVIAATKSKRYTRTRLDRMILCAYLGITEEMLTESAPYVRVLALNDRGRQILRTARRSGSFPNIGQVIDHPYQQLENRCGDLYGLFAQQPETPGTEKHGRVFCHK